MPEFESELLGNCDEIVEYISSKLGLLYFNLDGVHFRCGNKNLGHPWTDSDETVRVYRVDLETMQGYIFNFRSRRENRKLGSPTIIPCNIFPRDFGFFQN